MKNVFLLFILISFLYSCNSGSSGEQSPGALKKDTLKTPQSFFPVTAYLKGQLFEFKQKGITPIKYTTIKNHTDSVWLKLDEVEIAVKDFLTPEIDSINFTSLFTEKKFKDETIETFTFTYEPAVQLPDSIELRRWDVYIDPETNKVKRIYLVKEKADNRTVLLTWISQKWCTIVTILNRRDGTSEVEKEEKISWNF